MIRYKQLKLCAVIVVDFVHGVRAPVDNVPEGNPF